MLYHKFAARAIDAHCTHRHSGTGTLGDLYDREHALQSQYMRVMAHLHMRFSLTLRLCTSCTYGIKAHLFHGFQAHPTFGRRPRWNCHQMGAVHIAFQLPETLDRRDARTCARDHGVKSVRRLDHDRLSKRLTSGMRCECTTASVSPSVAGTCGTSITVRRYGDFDRGFPDCCDGQLFTGSQKAHPIAPPAPFADTLRFWRAAA